MYGIPGEFAIRADESARRFVGWSVSVRSGLTILLAAIVCVPLSACRDKEPTPSLYVDLGDASRPLPPPPKSPWLDTSLRSGRAEWQAFREPSAELPVNNPPDVAESVAPETDGGGGVTPEVAARVESEIRAMLADYNAAAAEGKTDELLDFYVLDQADPIRTIFTQQAAFVSTMAEFRSLLAGQLPAETGRINGVFDALNRQARERLVIGAIAVIRDGEATGVMTQMPGDTLARFVVEEDAWYIELPEAYMAGALGKMPPLLQAFEQAKTALASGQVPAEQTLTGFEQIAANLGLIEAAGDPVTASPDGGAPDVRPVADATGADADAAPEPSPELLRAGSDAFTTAHCIKCHGQNGTGGPRAPDLTDGDWVHCDGSVEGILAVIRSGVPQGSLVNKNYPFAMNPATNFIQDDATLLALATYVHSLSK